MSLSKKGELAKNTVIMAFGKIFTQFLSFLLLPLYTYHLSTYDYGLVDLVLTYITLLIPVITIQQEMATFRYLVDARGKNGEISKIVSTSIKSVFFRIVIFLTFFLPIAICVNLKYKYLIAIAGIFIAFSNLFLQIARGLGQNVKYTIGAFIAGVVTLLSNIYLICFMRLGGESLLISMSLANVACIVYEFFALGISNYFKSISCDKDLRKNMVSYSWPLVPNGISWWLIEASDRTIISSILGVAANGIYAISNKFPSIMGGILGIFTMSWTESASLHINDDDRDEFFSSVASNVLRIFSSLCIVIIAALPFVFNIIIGKNYIEAYNYVPIALVASMFNCIVSVYSAVYVAKKLTKKVAMTSIIAAIINIVTDLILINYIGLYAAVLSTAIAYAIMAFYRHFDVKKYVNIRYNPIDIILVIIGFGVIITLYYINHPVLNIISVIVAVAYTLLQNRKIFTKIIKS